MEVRKGEDAGLNFRSHYEFIALPFAEKLRMLKLLADPEARELSGYGLKQWREEIAILTEQQRLLSYLCAVILKLGEDNKFVQAMQTTSFMTHLSMVVIHDLYVGLLCCFKVI